MDRLSCFWFLTAMKSIRHRQRILNNAPIKLQQTSPLFLNNLNIIPKWKTIIAIPLIGVHLIPYPITNRDLDNIGTRNILSYCCLTNWHEFHIVHFLGYDIWLYLFGDTTELF